MTDIYDLAVIGTGPGGYVCAIRAAQLGMKVAVVEKRATHGGTCLNIGCIPSKALLHASERFDEAGREFAHLGISISKPKLDLKAMMGHKSETVDANVQGVEFLLKKNKIDSFHGTARILGAGKVEVTPDKGAKQTVEAKNIVIATGSAVAPLPGVGIDEKRIVSSTGALALDKVPGHLVVVGAGVIGLELGSVYARLGTKVTVVEFLDVVTPGMDGEVQKTFQRLLKRQGLDFIMGAAVQKAEAGKGKATVTYKLRKDDSEAVLEADCVLVATGRKPFTDGLGLAALGVEMEPRGQIRTDPHWQTSVPGIHAIGDAIAGPMLAHKAEDEGMALAEVLAGKHGHVNYDVIPGVIYTAPEVASVGKTEEALKAEGRAYKVGKFSFMGNGRAKAVFQGDGFVKILADKETDRVLGAHIIGPAAGELIHELCVGMEFGASAQDIALTCHAHPTFSEAVREAALACGDGPIHS